MQDGAAPMTDWGALADRALAGDRLAYGRLARLVTNYLLRWRARDFMADWDDIVQEVLVSTLKAHREDRLATPAAFQAYVRQAARFRFVDRLRRATRASDAGLDDADVSGDEESGDGLGWPPRESIGDTAVELSLEVRRALDGLEDRERRSVMEVYVRGRTYEEAAEATGIPLGSLKRALRTGLSSLREAIDA